MKPIVTFVKIQAVDRMPDGETEGVFSEMVVNANHIIFINQWAKGYYGLNLHGYDEWIIITESTYRILCSVFDVANTIEITDQYDEAT